MGLGGSAHEEEASIFEQQLVEEGLAFVFEAKLAYGAEADGSDGAIGLDRFFVIAVPRHSLGSVLVEVCKACVELAVAERLCAALDCKEAGRPWVRGFGGAGVGIRNFGVCKPCGFSGGANGFSEEAQFVVLPRDLAKERAHEVRGLGV